MEKQRRKRSRMREPNEIEESCSLHDGLRQAFYNRSSFWKAETLTVRIVSKGINKKVCKMSRGIFNSQPTRRRIKPSKSKPHLPQWMHSKEIQPRETNQISSIQNFQRVVRSSPGRRVTTGWARPLGSTAHPPRVTPPPNLPGSLMEKRWEREQVFHYRK